MASFKRRKEALRAALYAFLAGAHYVTEEVEKAQSLTVGGSDPDAIEIRHGMLEADFERVCESAQSIETLGEILDEEDLYPFGSEWPREALGLLMSKLIAPKLSLEGEDSDLRFRFKKGFKSALSELAGSLESGNARPPSLDHWMVQLLNISFHAGTVVAARLAENPKLYYNVIPEIEEESEPWSRYAQIADTLDKQLRRETRMRTGLVSDLDSDL